MDTYGDMEYIWRNIMKAVAFFFKNLEPTQSLQRFVFPFVTFMVDLAFGNQLASYQFSRAKGFISTNAQLSALLKMLGKTLRRNL